MIENWNRVVQPQDIVYHLGDFGFGTKAYLENIIRRLNGRIVLIKGNHDKTVLQCEGFDSIVVMQTIQVNDEDAPNSVQNIALCHYPMLAWDRQHYGAWHLFGHCHGTLKGASGSIDVGVDCNDFTPLSYEDIKIKIFKRGLPKDPRHGRN